MLLKTTNEILYSSVLISSNFAANQEAISGFFKAPNLFQHEW